MPTNRRPPDSEEIDRIARMAREGRDFYKGLAKSLGPQESLGPAELSEGAGEEKGQERQDQQN